MIDATKFARKTVQNDDKSFFRFGLASPQETAEVLRQFADQIEQGKICITKVQSGSIADVDEWATNAIMIEYVLREGYAVS